MKNFASIILVALVLLVVNGCQQRNLRGWYEPSKDGRTYLVVEEARSPDCTPLYVDGVEWPVGLGQPHAITPGEHYIECTGDTDEGIGFIVPAGTVYHYDYWGP